MTNCLWKICCLWNHSDPGLWYLGRDAISTEVNLSWNLFAASHSAKTYIEHDTNVMCKGTIGLSDNPVLKGWLWCTKQSTSKPQWEQKHCNWHCYIILKGDSKLTAAENHSFPSKWKYGKPFEEGLFDYFIVAVMLPNMKLLHNGRECLSFLLKLLISWQILRHENKAGYEALQFYST